MKDMVFTTEILERLGIHEQPGEVEQLVLETMEQMLSSWRVSDPKRDLTSAEREALTRGNLTLEQPDLGVNDPLVRSSAEYSAMLATSITVPKVAKMLGVDSSRIRQRLASRTLYGIKRRDGWRLPLFQFDGDRVLTGIELVLPRLRPELHPLAVYHWFTTPNVDLVLGDDERPVSPRAWLCLGLDPEDVVALAAEL